MKYLLHRNAEHGQAIVIIALTMIVLLGFAGLAIDGGNAYVHRRIAQNAADAAAFGGTAYMAGVNPTESGLLAEINRLAEANSIPDSNGTTGDTVNSNVTAYYVDANSNRLSGCNQIGTCSSIPAAALGVEAKARFEFSASFAQLVGFSTLVADARAVAVLHRGGGSSGPAIFAGSQTCQNTIDLSGSTNNIIGGVHSNNDIKVGGQTNTITGSVTYVTSVDAPPDKITYVPPPPSNPVQTTPISYPVNYQIADYAPGGTKAVAAAAAGKYYSCNCKMDKGWLESQGLYNDSTRVLQDGLYYTTDQIDLSASAIIGNAVTFVARKEITFSGSNHRLRPYVDGLLTFTDYTPPGGAGAQCNTFATKMSGSTHDWQGIMYAPNGLIEMSGSSNSSVHGSIIAYTVKLNGSELFIQYNPNYLPPEPDRIDLIR